MAEAPTYPGEWEQNEELDRRLRETMDRERSMSPELQMALKLAREAAKILKKYHRTALDVDYKKDEFDPVSVADKESDELLRAGIAAVFPDDAILSEESPLRPESYEGRVWMIDPLDDTKGYLRGEDTSSIMIGLLEAGKPKVGLVYLPFRDEYYYGEVGKGSFVSRLGDVKKLQVPSTLQIEGSRLVGRHVLAGDVRPIDQAVAQLGFGSTVVEGSIGAKIGLIAEGKADAFIHTNLKAGKWDTLASEVVLSEAGGASLVDIDGKPLDYTKPDSGWNRYFMAACTPELLQEMISKLGEVNEQTHTF
jgi:3'-phosphoadenosine 5'-phosphosulfate (PAPS) 3'-phosphatase